MGKLIKNNLGNFLAIFVIAILVFVGIYYFFYRKSSQAQLDRVKIIPTGYTIYFEDWSTDKPGWQNPEAALVQDLGPTASFEEFNRENSAFPMEVATSSFEQVVTESEELTPQPSSESEGQVVSESEPFQEEVVTSSFEQLATESGELFIPPIEDEILSPSEPFEEIPVSPSEGAQVPSVLGILLASPSDDELATGSEKITFDEIATESEEIIEGLATESPSFVPTDIGTSEGKEEIATVSEEGIYVELVPLDEIDQVPGVEDFVEKHVEYFDFTLPEEFSADGKTIKNIQLRLSMAFEGGTNQDIVDIEYKYSRNSRGSGEAGWHLLAEYFLSDSNSNATNNGYWLYGFPILKNWKDLENLRIRFTYRGTAGEIYLDALWLEVEYEYLEAPSKEEGEVELISGKKDFKLDEEPEFEFKYQRKAGLLKKAVGLLEDEYKDIKIRATVEGLDISPNIRYQGNGEFLIDLAKSSCQFRPGKYKLRIEVEDPSTSSGQVMVYEQEFTWGVLAINTNKSIYLPGEQAYLQMAVLNDDGRIICNADLKLEIISPDGQTTYPEVQKSNKCGPDNVTDVPDYFAYYDVGEAGIYEMKLINLDNGYEITNSFEVRDSVPFEVERIGPTRIYPPATYQMILRIKANRDFAGEIIEYVPTSFEIKSTIPDSKSQILNSDKQIIWQVDWKAGEIYELKYTFDAPNISPYLYLLGPLEMRPASGIAFGEARQWQIAADAILTTLRPVTPDGTKTNLQYSTGTTAWSLIDDDPDSPDNGDYIYESTHTTTTAFLNITDMPADFSSMDTLYVKIYLDNTATWDDDTSTLYAQMFQSNESSTLSDEMQLATQATSDGVINVQFTNVSAGDKNTWDNALLRFRWVNVKKRGPDNDYLRVTAAELDGTYTAAGNNAPTIGAISLQGTGVTTINLVEGSAVDIMASAQITDQQGCTDVRDGGGVKAIVYLYDEQTASCSQDNNNCYNEDIASCSWQSTSGNTCNYECTASSAMYYYADPTVSGGGTASKADEEWAVTIIASDSYWEDVTSNSWDPGASGSTSAEVALLLGLDVAAGGSDSIDYGSLNPGQDSDETGGVLERGVKNTGNRPMNPLIQQTTALTKGSDTISADRQQFANTSFTVGNGTSLSASNQTLDLELPQRIDDTGASDSDDQLFWGIYVPLGQAPGNYNGTNTYTADAD